MPVALLLGFLAVPLIELYVIVVIARATNVPFTLALLFGVSVAGALLVKREGSRAWQAFRMALSTRRAPAREVTDGALVLSGGALLLTPGFVTDAVGLLLVLPPTRAVIRRMLTGWFARRLVGTTRRHRSPHRSPLRPPQDSPVVEGDIVDPPTES